MTLMTHRVIEGQQLTSIHLLDIDKDVEFALK